MDVRALADDRKGQLYVGLNGGGVLRYSDGEWTQFSRSDGLADERVWSLYVDREDTVWIGTYGRGLSRLKGGKIFNFPTSPFRLPGIITSILEDDAGKLWLGSILGICRVDRKELNELAEGGRASIAPMNYGTADGPRQPPSAPADCNPPPGRARDGRLWFATVAGVSVVESGSFALQSDSPTGRDRGSNVGRRVHSQGNRKCHDCARQASLGNSLHRPEFYGAEPGAIQIPVGRMGPQLGRSRRSAHRLFYPRLIPATIAFAWWPCNNDGVWNETGRFTRRRHASVLLANDVVPRIVGSSSAGKRRWPGPFCFVAESSGRNRAIATGERRETRSALASLTTCTMTSAQISRRSVSSVKWPGEMGKPRSASNTIFGSSPAWLQEVVRHLDELVWVVNPDHDHTASFY